MSEKLSKKSQDSSAAPKAKASPQAGRKSEMRTKIGWIAVGLCAMLVLGALKYKSTGEVAFLELNRTCVIMILLWLAWPELEALPRWLLYAVPICVVACAWRPQLLIVVLPATLIYLMLRPPARRRKKK